MWNPSEFLDNCYVKENSNGGEWFRSFLSELSTGPSREPILSSGVSEDAFSDSLVLLEAKTSHDDDTGVTEICGEREVTSSNNDINLEPYIGKEFKSEQDAKAFYNGYARHMGFSIRKGPLYRSSRDRAITSRIFVCSKEGFRRETSDVNDKGNVKRRMAVTRVGCKAQLWVKKQASGVWVVKHFQRDHNHELAPMKPHLLRSHKNMLENVKDYVETLKGVGVDTSKIQSLFVEEARAIGKIGETEKDTESEDKKKIHELTVELHRERRRSAAYREQLTMVLKEVEDHANYLSTKVEDIVENLKEVESRGAKDLT
ncbi:protein FAR1-RELATED SEQUENCE 5-like isoform X1 [Papaver somniferum]|uniref:protein FAR1-RELATED SEQUENCE 5-like isoform X1 n=1 Tax=Papaver somniferum TaxID=3469 RepID=UPI000E70605F|nr:protein FAR1-RELATED SEQUENCE 5-like isoform X1 [Papaver somniferum]XP_026432593.1 protein FAR1-RELATED SEQUENCE 5-like isoform X1 [Papaver somniferum]